MYTLGGCCVLLPPLLICPFDLETLRGWSRETRTEGQKGMVGVEFLSLAASPARRSETHWQVP